LLDVSSYLYFPKTHTCFECYIRLQLRPVAESCFGHQPSDSGYTYDPQCPECSMFCRDRFICPQFISGEAIMAKELAMEHRQLILDRFKAGRLRSGEEKRKAKWAETPFAKGSILEAVFKKCVAGTTYTKLGKYLGAIGVANPKQYLTAMRRQDAHGLKWEFKDDEQGNIEINY